MTKDAVRLPVTILLPDDLPTGQSIYEACLTEARCSDCAKAKFGAVLVLGHPHASGIGGLAACNHRIPPLAHLCDPTCIRLDIPSRTDGLVGACAHAEETVLWAAKNLGVDLRDAALFVGGLDNEGNPWRRKGMRWTCLRCAIAMWHAGLRKVIVPVYESDTSIEWLWVAILVENALRDAVDFATGKASAE